MDRKKLATIVLPEGAKLATVPSEQKRFEGEFGAFLKRWNITSTDDVSVEREGKTITVYDNQQHN